MLTGIGNDGIGALTGDSCIWMSSVIICSNLSGVIYGSIVMAINEQSTKLSKPWEGFIAVTTNWFFHVEKQVS